MKEVKNKQLRDVQLVELDILKEFHKICKKNNLKYVLAAGTLLGAIRHEGFIPWDDDIDVYMMREDYNKFIEIQKKELNQNKFYFQSMETEELFGLPFAKLRRKDSIYSESTCPLPEDKQGIWIDIFPIDKISDNKFLSYIIYIKVFYYKTIIAHKLNFKFESKGIKRFILNTIKVLSKFYSIDRAKRKYYKIINKWNKKDTIKIVNYGGMYLTKEIFKKNYLSETILHTFETGKYSIPKYYDDYLKYMYGDYMKLPPKEKRASHHLVEELKLP